MEKLPQTTMTDYAKILEHTAKLPWVVLVTTGRTGSDFFQSLMDSHPEAFVFNGKLQFHQYWKKCHCRRAATPPASEDVADEFIGTFIYKFKSKYRVVENKDKLGPHQDQSISIDTRIFREHLVGLLELRELTPRNILEAIYTAYALSLNQDVLLKKIFFHHQHHIFQLPEFLKDFPGSPVISMTRDPRALLVSGVEHWAKFDPATDHGGHYFTVLHRAFEDANEVRSLGVPYIVLKLEDLGNENVLQRICDWMGISMDACMQSATWGGLRWWGDRLSVAQASQNEAGFSPAMVTNRWEKKLGRLDKYLIGYLLQERLQHYGYPVGAYRGAHHFWAALLTCWIPTVYERRFLSPAYARKSFTTGRMRDPIKGIYFYFRRVLYYYKLLFRKMRGSVACHPLCEGLLLR